MSPDRRVFLGMPGYGEMTAGAARGFWRATKLPDKQVCYVYKEGSLLASNFNSLWVSALNLAHKGEAPDLFAMQHADVEPEDWWLDTLADEMDARGLDVLGVAVPIKDQKGTTSIALGRPDGDPWRPLCRLTLSEVYRLPETFTSEDVGHPILLNTGLWVCRFDPAWAKKVRFTINDRIIFDRSTDSYRAQTEPEDWYFSRLCHELGLKVGCTRKIKLTHRGPAQFGNARPWGEPFDSAWVGRSVLDDLPPRFVWPDAVPGWLTPEEGEALAELAAGKRVLEVGSYCGLSTVCMARTAESVVAVDTFDGRGTPDPRPTTAEFSANLDRYGVADKVTAWEVEFERFARTYDGPRFDLVFVDGAHDAESVASDIAGAVSLLAPGGRLAFHDYGIDHPAVTAAVDALVAAGGEIVSLTGSLAAVRPPAESPVLQSLEV